MTAQFATKLKPRLSLSVEIRKIILLILLHSLVPMIGLILYINLENRAALQKNLIKSYNTLLSTIGNEIEGKMKNVKLTLTLLDTLNIFTKEDTDYCNLVTQKLQSTMPIFSVIGAADLDGNIYCSSFISEKPINVTDRLYFQEAIKNQTFTLGEFVIGKIAGTPTINFALPLFDEKSQLQSVAIAGFNLSYLENLILTFDLPDEFNLTIFDKNGVVLARQPYNSEMLGKNDSGDPAITKILSGNSNGSFILKDNPSGKEKIYVHKQLNVSLGGGAIYAYLDSPTSYLQDQANHKLFSDIVLVAFTVILVAVIVTIDWQIYIRKMTYNNHPLKEPKLE